MSSTPQFARCDTRKLDGCYVQFERIILDDPNNERPDQHDQGFWPSQNPDDCGYVGEVSAAEFSNHVANAQARMRAWERGDWSYVGVRARAKCFVVVNGTGTYINIDSPGLWGIESDAGDYLNEVYREEIEELKGLLAAMQNPQYEG